jgi:hypothetical protein
VGSQDIATHFLDEVLSQDVAHINDLFFLGDTQVALGIFFSCVVHQLFYLTWTIPPSSFLSLLASFNMIVMQA